MALLIKGFLVVGVHSFKKSLRHFLKTSTTTTFQDQDFDIRGGLFIKYQDPTKLLRSGVDFIDVAGAFKLECPLLKITVDFFDRGEFLARLLFNCDILLKAGALF